MIKLWQIFQLDEAVSGFEDNGIAYDPYSFTINKYPNGTFETEEEAIGKLILIMEDYRKRNVDEEARFIILPVFVSNRDKIFKVSSTI